MFWVRNKQNEFLFMLSYLEVWMEISGSQNPHSGPHICVDPEGAGGADLPLENRKAIGFLSNTGPDPLENHTATKPAFNVGPLSARQQNVI